MLFGSQSEKRTSKHRSSRRQKARRRTSTTRRVQRVESLEDRRLMAVAGGFASQLAQFRSNLNQRSWFGTDQVQQGLVQTNFFGLGRGSAAQNIDDDAPGLKVQPPVQENPAQPGGGDDGEEQKPKGEQEPKVKNEQPEERTLEQLEQQRAELQQQHEQNEAQQRELDQDGEIDPSEETQWNELQEKIHQLRDQLRELDQKILEPLQKQREELERQRALLGVEFNERLFDDNGQMIGPKEQRELLDSPLSQQLKDLDKQLGDLKEKNNGLESQSAVNGQETDEEINEPGQENENNQSEPALSPEEEQIRREAQEEADRSSCFNKSTGKKDIWIWRGECDEEDQPADENQGTEKTEQNDDTDNSQDSPKPDNADPENSKQGSLQGTDKLASQRGTRFVIVGPGEPLQLGLAGNEKFETSRDVEYTDPGATCHDYVDGVTDRKADADNVIPSDYKIRYDCPDLPGNQSQPERPPVIVEDRRQSLVDPVDADKMFSEAGFPYIDAGAEAMDSIDGMDDNTQTVDPTDSGSNPLVYPFFNEAGGNDQTVDNYFHGLRYLEWTGPYFHNDNRQTELDKNTPKSETAAPQDKVLVQEYDVFDRVIRSTDSTNEPKSGLDVPYDDNNNNCRPDPRFLDDPSNYAIPFSSGYPLAIPSGDGGQGETNQETPSASDKDSVDVEFVDTVEFFSGGNQQAGTSSSTSTPNSLLIDLPVRPLSVEEIVQQAPKHDSDTSEQDHQEVNQFGFGSRHGFFYMAERFYNPFFNPADNYLENVDSIFGEVPTYPQDSAVEIGPEGFFPEGSSFNLFGGSLVK